MGLSTDVKGLLTDQRIAVEGLFDDNRVTLGQLIEVNTHPTAARVLAYSYYGSSDLGESITILNGFSDASFIEGDIEIVTS